MKLLTILIISCSLNSFCSLGKELERPSYYIVADTLNSVLDSTEGIYYFDFAQVKTIAGVQEVIYAVDHGANQTFIVGENPILEINTAPGDHSFAFYINEFHNEIEIADLELKPQHNMHLKVTFKSVLHQNTLRKPVIYLYPQDTIDVSIDVKPTGPFTFTYPPIESGWNFECTPQGKLTKDLSSYPYLFWESMQQIDASMLDLTFGKVIAGNKVVSFLEKQLNAFGMNGAERADFITYWGPILQNKTNLYIYFLFDEKCDALASLKIDPTPNTVARIYMLWSEVPTNYSPDLESQDIPGFQRNGFTVLEWGGMEFDASLLYEEEL